MGNIYTPLLIATLRELHPDFLLLLRWRGRRITVYWVVVYMGDEGVHVCSDWTCNY